MADPRQHAPLVGSGEEMRAAIPVRHRPDAVMATMQIDGRHGDLRLPRKLGFDACERRIAGRMAVTVPIGLYHDVDEIGIVERDGALLEDRFVEAPFRRPQLPQQPADVAPVLGKAGVAALGVEIVLVPQAMLLLGRCRLARGRDVLDVVTRAAHQATHPFGPQGRCDTGGAAAPVVAGQGRSIDAERIHELQQVVAQRRLLARTRRRGRQESRRTVAAQIGHQHPATLGCQGRGDLVEGPGVIGEAMQQDHRRAVFRAMLLVGHLQHVGAGAFRFHDASLARRVDRVAGHAHPWRNGGIMARYDRVIRGGMIVDGSRLPRFRGDIGIKHGRVAEIGHIGAAEADETIDAGGLIVAPGFVDLHTHYDAQLFWDPYCSISSWHGVTSIVIGNCGFGFAPVRPSERERAMQTMTRVEAIPYHAMKEGMPWDWESFPEFMDSIDRTPKAMNILPYMAISPLLVYVMGLEAAKTRPPSEQEEREICRLLDEAMDAGACGWSAQRLDPNGPACVQRDFDGTPMVSDLMTDETCLALAQVLGRRNEGFMQMTLVSADPMHDLNHFEQLAEVSGRPILYNVVQPRDSHPYVHRGQIEWLENCRKRGLRVYGQAVTSDTGMMFTFVDWNLFDECQAWCDATTGTGDERKAKLADPGRREALRARLPRVITDEFEQIFVTQVERDDMKEYEGLTLREFGERTGKHPVDAMLDLAVADDLRTEFYAPGPNQNMDYMKEMLDYPYLIPGVSDGGAHTKFFTGGQYPTEFLQKLVREHNMMTLEEAHWRLSALPAMCAGFRERGTLRVAAPADVVVYDYENLAMGPIETVRDFPGGEWRRVQKAKGYKHVMVNGEVTLNDGEPTGASSGRLLRHGA